MVLHFRNTGGRAAGKAEVNVGHALLKRLDGEQGERFNELAVLLFEQSVLAEGGRLEDPAAFVRRVNQFLVDAAG